MPVVVLLLLTVRPGVGAADAGDGGAARHDEQVVVTLVVSGLGLRQHEVAEVQSERIVLELRLSPELDT